MKVKRDFAQKERGIRITRFMKRDGSVCWLCGEQLDRSIREPDHPRYITFDHVIPLAQGGPDADDNIRLAHKRCNNERGHGSGPGSAPAGQKVDM